MTIISIIAGCLLLISSLLMLAFSVEHSAPTKTERFAQIATIGIGLLNLIWGIVSVAVVFFK